MSVPGTILEDEIAGVFKKRGYIVFKRKNHCDIVAVKPDMRLVYLVECKNYELTRKQQLLAVRELNRNYVHALELLLEKRLHPTKILKVLVAQGFTYQAKDIFQYSPSDFLKHLEGG